MLQTNQSVRSGVWDGGEEPAVIEREEGGGGMQRIVQMGIKAFLVLYMWKEMAVVV